MVARAGLVKQLASLRDKIKEGGSKAEEDVLMVTLSIFNLFTLEEIMYIFGADYPKYVALYMEDEDVLQTT